MKLIKILFPVLLCIFISCKEKTTKAYSPKVEKKQESKKEDPKPKDVTPAEIELSKELAFEKHTLNDSYPYKNKTREFQWDKIKEFLAQIENFQDGKSVYGVLQNYQNSNGTAPTISNFKRDSYTRVADSFGTERYQAAPLYENDGDKKLTRYGKDGWLVKIQGSDSSDRVKIEGVSFEGIYEVPKKYLKTIGDSVRFEKVIAIDKTNQNIATLDKGEKGWIIRSMNPATTGLHQPPHKQETPSGLFVVQQHKSKMYYFKDGTKSIEGYAPYATRFTQGAYVHGVPVNNPNGKVIEYSATLGTTPRSHMCVRNASSHARFVYDRSKDYQTLVIVFD